MSLLNKELYALATEQAELDHKIRLLNKERDTLTARRAVIDKMGRLKMTELEMLEKETRE
jgi:hypothetical protein